MANPTYTTLSAVKARMNATDHSPQTAAEAVRDATLTMCMNQAIASIKRYMGFDILSQSYTEYFDGDGRSVLVLPYPNVTAIASLTANGQTITAMDQSNAGYLLTSARILTLTSPDGFPAPWRFWLGKKNVCCQFTAGLAACPDDLAEAVADFTIYLFQQAPRMGIMSRSEGGVNYSYQTLTLPVSIRLILDSYRLGGVNF